MKAPEIVVLTLTNGDCALFINQDAVLTLDADEAGKDPATVGHFAARALGVACQNYHMETPEDPEWSWQDAYKLMPYRAKLV